MKSHLNIGLLATTAMLALVTAHPAQAQTIGYGGASGMGGGAPAGAGSGADQGDAADDSGDGDTGGQRQRRERHVEVSPYIEVAQVAQMQISPGSDVVTYSVAAAGVDASFQGRNNQGAISLRYERSIGWSGSTQDQRDCAGIDCRRARRRVAGSWRDGGADPG